MSGSSFKFINNIECFKDDLNDQVQFINFFLLWFVFFISDPKMYLPKQSLQSFPPEFFVDHL